MRIVKHKKLRLFVALLVTTLGWPVRGVHVVGSPRWVLTGSGGWVPVYPQPFEIIFLTLCAVVVTIWLYKWYSRDRVERLVSTLDTVERHRLLDRLLDQHLRSAQSLPPEKRKRLADDGELMTDEDDGLTGAESADWRVDENEAGPRHSDLPFPSSGTRVGSEGRYRTCARRRSM